MGGDGIEANPWEQTPWWHPAAWFGWRMRRWWWDGGTISGEYDGQWEYATYKQRALANLAEQFGRQSDNAGTEGGISYGRPI